MSNLYVLTIPDLVVMITVKSVCLIDLIIDIVIYLVTYILSIKYRIDIVMKKREGEGGRGRERDGWRNKMEGERRGGGRRREHVT